MKTGLLWGALLCALVALGGCAGGELSGGGPAPGAARCSSRPDPMGTAPLIYLFCVQSG